MAMRLFTLRKGSGYYQKTGSLEFINAPFAQRKRRLSAEEAKPFRRRSKA